jgi:hypothetical protein
MFSVVVLGMTSFIYHARLWYLVRGQDEGVIVGVIPTDMALNTMNGGDADAGTVIDNIHTTSVGWTSLSQHDQHRQHQFPTTNNSPTGTSTIPPPPPPDSLPICFITANYGHNVSEMDQLSNVSQLDWVQQQQQQQQHPTPPGSQSLLLYHFFVFTNQPSIVAPGWNKIIVEQEIEKVNHDIPIVLTNDQQKQKQKQTSIARTRSMIVQSRWPKFQAHHHSTIQKHCRVVFYMDATTEIVGRPYHFQQQAQRIVESTVGLAQYRHPYHYGRKRKRQQQQQQQHNNNTNTTTSSHTVTAIWEEFQWVLIYQKDTPSHVKVAEQWLKHRPDFRPNCTLYENRYIGYDLRATAFAKASDYFWSQYSNVGGGGGAGGYMSWRDQPLWCYVLDHFDIQPIPLRHRLLFRYDPRRMGKNQHKYDII